MDFGQVVGPAEARMIICLRDKGNIISSVPWKTCHEMYHGSQQKSKVNSGIGVEEKSSLTALIAGFIRLKLNLHQWLAEWDQEDCFAADFACFDPLVNLCVFLGSEVLPASEYPLPDRAPEVGQHDPGHNYSLHCYNCVVITLQTTETYRFLRREGTLAIQWPRQEKLRVGLWLLYLLNFLNIYRLFWIEFQCGRHYLWRYWMACMKGGFGRRLYLFFVWWEQKCLAWCFARYSRRHNSSIFKIYITLYHFQWRLSGWGWTTQNQHFLCTADAAFLQYVWCGTQLAPSRPSRSLQLWWS